MQHSEIIEHWPVHLSGPAGYLARRENLAVVGEKDQAVQLFIERVKRQDDFGVCAVCHKSIINANVNVCCVYS